MPRIIPVFSLRKFFKLYHQVSNAFRGFGNFQTFIVRVLSPMRPYQAKIVENQENAQQSRMEGLSLP